MNIQRLLAVMAIAAATQWSCTENVENPDLTPNDTGASVDSGTDTALPDDDTSSGPAYTYYRDVKPIIDARCTTCHVPDSIAPFPLRTFEEVKEVAPLVKASV